MRVLVFVFCLGMLFASCETAKLEQHFFAVNIVSEDNAIEEYLDHHKMIWPEVEAGFKAAGYREIQLLRFDHLIVMCITVPAGADLDEMSKKAAATSPRCAEWNQLMNRYQTGVPGTAEGQKWVELEAFYSFKNN